MGRLSSIFKTSFEDQSGDTFSGSNHFSTDNDFLDPYTSCNASHTLVAEPSDINFESNETTKQSKYLWLRPWRWGRRKTNPPPPDDISNLIQELIETTTYLSRKQQGQNTEHLASSADYDALVFSPKQIFSIFWIFITLVIAVTLGLIFLSISRTNELFLTVENVQNRTPLTILMNIDSSLMTSTEYQTYLPDFLPVDLILSSESSSELPKSPSELPKSPSELPKSPSELPKLPSDSNALITLGNISTQFEVAVVAYNDHPEPIVVDEVHVDLIWLKNLLQFVESDQFPMNYIISPGNTNNQEDIAQNFKFSSKLNQEVLSMIISNHNVINLPTKMSREFVSTNVYSGFQRIFLDHIEIYLARLDNQTVRDLILRCARLKQLVIIIRIEFATVVPVGQSRNARVLSIPLTLPCQIFATKHMSD